MKPRLCERMIFMRKSTLMMKDGLHARPAALVCRAASGFSSRVVVSIGDDEADASSIISMMALGAGAGSTVTVTADGDDEEEAVAAITKILDGDDTA